MFLGVLYIKICGLLGGFSFLEERVQTEKTTCFSFFMKIVINDKNTWEEREPYKKKKKKLPPGKKKGKK